MFFKVVLNKLSFLKKHKDIVFILSFLVIIILVSLLFLFKEKPLIIDKDPQYHFHPASQMEAVYPNYEAQVCQSNIPNYSNSHYLGKLKNIFEYLDTKGVKWVLFVGTEEDSESKIRTYIRIDSDIKNNWERIGDAQKAEILDFITREVASKYSLNKFEVWVADCTSGDERYIGFSGYHLEHTDKIRIFFDW